MKRKLSLSIDNASIEQKIIELKMYQNYIGQWMKKLQIHLTQECEVPRT